MKKTLCIAVLMIMSLGLAKAQGFSRVYDFGLPLFGKWGTSIVELPSGYLLSGFTADTISPYPPVGYIAKINPDGSEVFFDIERESPPGMVEFRGATIYDQQTGTYYVTGDRGVSVFQMKVMLMAFDTLGNRLWDSAYRDTNFYYQAAFAMQRLSNGDFVLGGHKQYVSNLNVDLDVVWVDSTGHLKNRFTFGTQGTLPSQKSRELMGAMIVKGNNHIVCGSVKTNSANANGTAVLSSTWIFETDTNGNILDQYNAPNNVTYEPSGMIETSDGGILYFSQYRYTWSGVGNSATPLCHPYIVKLNSNLDFQWAYQWTNLILGNATYRANLTKTVDGGYVFGGTAGSSNNTCFGPVYICKIDSLGNELWQRRYCSNLGIDYEPSVYKITATSDNGIILTGGEMNPQNQTNVWVLKLDSMGCIMGGCENWHEDDVPTKYDAQTTSTEENEVTEITIYPNPTSGTSILTWNPLINPTRLIICSITGEVVQDIPLQEFSGSIELDARDMAAGVYILKLALQDGSYEFTRWVVQK